MSSPPRLPFYPRLIAGACRFALRSLSRIRIEGLENAPTNGPLIIASNHTSLVDPPVLGGWLAPRLGQRPMFLAKESLFRPVLGPILRSFGASPVKTGGSDMAAYRAAKAVLDADGVVAILPEGTRSFDGILAQPKPGVGLLATRTGTPVLPVGISGADAFLGRGRRLPRIGAPITVRIGRPFELSIHNQADRREALKAADAELMRRIAALLDERHRGTWEPWPDA